MRPLYTALAVACLAAGACTDEATQPDTIAVRDSAGITIVQYPAIPAGLPTRAVGSAPELRVGSFDGDGPDAFGLVTGVAELSNGHVTTWPRRILRAVRRTLAAGEALTRHSRNCRLGDNAGESVVDHHDCTVARRRP